MTINRLLPFFLFLFFAISPAHALFAVQGSKDQNTQALPLANLFDEAILADNAAAIRQHASELPDQERYQQLIEWVLPSESHVTIRMQGEFTQTNPAPANRVDSSQEHISGGRIASPVFDLLETARKLNQLDGLLQQVEAIPESHLNEQQRAKTALLTLLYLETGNTDAVAKSSDRLLQLVRASSPKNAGEMWPEMLVVYRHVIRQQTAPGLDELLSYLFAQRTQLDFLPTELKWHTQIASLAGEKGHRESATPAVTDASETEMSQWVPISRRRALTRGQGFAGSKWGRAGSQVYKISGHDDDYLFFRSPLTGDYEVQCDVTAFTTQSMAAGTFVGNDGDKSHLWVGTFRNSASRVDSKLNFSGFDDWIRQRSVVQNSTCTTSLNGLAAYTEQFAGSPDPWFAVRNWWRMHSAARDVRITGNPIIPEAVKLSTATDLRGWYPYYEVSAGYPGAVWEHFADDESASQILGHGGAQQGSYCESLLAYQRPLDSVGSMEFEFFYEPGQTEVHPALDRMVFYLQPEGVRIHWLTDGPFDQTELGPDNLSEILHRDDSASPIPLNPGQWNQMKIVLNQQTITLELNGQPICQTTIDVANDRVFGLFHYADQTEARVRNVVMRGSWPTKLPDVTAQELADNRTAMLDADLVNLPDVFTYQFTASQIPVRFFEVGRNQPDDTVSAGRDGLQIVRPGGGPWFDTHVHLPFMIHGDFDMEIGFEEFKAIGDKFGCVMLVVELDDERRRQCRILRIRDELQRQELHSSLSELHQDGNRSFSARPPKKSEAAAGRMRMARRGTTLYYLFAENDSSEFRVLETEKISDSSSVADGLHFHTMCDGQGETSVLWKSITVRAERLTLKPDSTERPPISLYSINADGTNLRKLAAPPRGFIQIGSGEWSSDGRKLIGDMSNGGIDTSRVVLMNTDGSDMKELGPGCMPSLSPDNKEIVFSQPGAGIMKMNADGSKRTQIDASGWGTQWSPDGKHIAWAAGNNVVLLNTKTNQRSQLLTAEQSAQFGYVYWNLGWSQNSKSIAFKARKRDGAGSVVAVSDADSVTGFGVVYDGPDHINEEFSLSPDGRNVLISLKRTGAPAKLFIVNRDAPNDVKLLPGQPELWDVYGGDWSPDGKQIAFSATVPHVATEWPPQ
jgi:Tol biopolymer transport system component